jgi:dolichol-phosphate mannosyltransferase
VKASGFANALARKVTGVDLSDPMSGYFMLRGETLRADAGNLSGVGFKILLDILPPLTPLRVKEFPQLRSSRRGRKQTGSHRRVRIPCRPL